MNREHKWEVGVSSGAYYPDLTQTFGNCEIGLAYEDDMGMQFFAYSYHIDELDNPREVAKRLYSLELLLNGALRVAWIKIPECSTRFTYFFELPKGNHHEVWTESIEEYPFSTNPHIDQFCYDCHLNRLTPSYILHLTRQSEELRTILFLCGLISTNTPQENILTWATLYKIVDCVKTYSKAINISIKELVDDSKLNTFTAACNNMSILGLNARHGASNNPAPTRVMVDLNDAITLILEMTHKFVLAFHRSNALR